MTGPDGLEGRRVAPARFSSFAQESDTGTLGSAPLRASLQIIKSRRSAKWIQDAAPLTARYARVKIQYAPLRYACLPEHHGYVEPLRLTKNAAASRRYPASRPQLTDPARARWSNAGTTGQTHLFKFLPDQSPTPHTKGSRVNGLFGRPSIVSLVVGRRHCYFGRELFPSEGPSARAIVSPLPAVPGWRHD